MLVSWQLNKYGITCSVSEQGKFKGLDLNEELFVGGYPNYSMLAKTAGLKTGFVGKKTVKLCEFCSKVSVVALLSVAFLH